MSRTIVAVVGIFASCFAVCAQAQDAAVLSRLYGSGVHEYFAGDYSKAYDELNTAIKTGSQDPRAFFFRGLSLLKLGRAEDATADFKKGSELECADVNKTFNVPKALERVQGEGRRQIEVYRAESRKIAYAREEKLRKTRYEALRREEERVLLRQAEGGAFKATVKPETEAVAAEASKSDDAEPVAPKAAKKKVAAKKTTKPAEDESDPFASPSEEKAPAAKPAAKPAEKKPADKSDDEEENPFG